MGSCASEGCGVPLQTTRTGHDEALAEGITLYELGRVRMGEVEATLVTVRPRARVSRDTVECALTTASPWNKGFI